MKNLNSFKAIARAIEGERERQIELIEAGKKVVQETRRWDDNKESFLCNAFQRGCTGLSLLPGTGSGADRDQ